MEKKDYKEYSDELLVRMARDGDEKAEDFLLKKYKDFVRSKARAYFLVGGDSDDLIQELSLIHISEPTRRTPISYAVFCLKKKKIHNKYS